MAGFDTSSTIMSAVLYYLAKSPKVQDRMRGFGDDEQFVDEVVKEALRFFPVAPIERLCVKDYKVPNRDFIIPRGMMIQIPASAIMKDSKYFGPDPGKFDPDRFKQHLRHDKFPFLAFGQGQRNCIGMRFAMMQVKIAIKKIVSNFRILPCEKTCSELEHDSSPHPQIKGGVWIKVQKLK